MPTKYFELLLIVLNFFILHVIVPSVQIELLIFEFKEIKIMSKEIFAERLKTSMAQQEKKQVDLIRAASEHGVKLGKSHISQYVSGKTLPKPDILHFLAFRSMLTGCGAMNRQAQMRALPTMPVIPCTASTQFIKIILLRGIEK